MPKTIEIKPPDVSSDEGTFTMVQTPTSVTYEKKPEVAPTGQAYIEPARAKNTRELEMAAGAARVAKIREELKTRPPRIISDAEKRATGSSVEVFRPNDARADRVISHDGAPVSQQLGALMRRVAGNGMKPASGV
jgi:hypothetical protein